MVSWFTWREDIGFIGPHRKMVSTMGQRDHETGDVKISVFFSVANSYRVPGTELLHMQWLYYDTLSNIILSYHISLFFFSSWWPNTYNKEVKGRMLCFGSWLQSVQSIMNPGKHGRPENRARQETGRDICSQEATLNDLLHVARGHLLKLPETPRIVSLFGEEVFRLWTDRGCCTFKLEHQ